MQMRRTVNLDAGLKTKEQPTVANRLFSPRPTGCFATDYGPDKTRVKLEAALSKLRQKPER